MSTENQNAGHQSFGEGHPQIESSNFVDRRDPVTARNTPGLERRQFSNTYSDLSTEATELGKAIDQYKLINRRRYITYEEMLSVIKSIGYSK